MASVALEFKKELNQLGDYVLQTNTAPTGWFAISALTLEKKISLAKTSNRHGRWEAMTKLCDYVKTAEAAEILGVAQNTLRKWAEAA